MSRISRHAAAGENPASFKPPVEETHGRKIVKGLFCAGVALSAILCAPHVSAASVYADQQTKKITVGTGESYGTVNGDVYGGHGSENASESDSVSGYTVEIKEGAVVEKVNPSYGGSVLGGFIGQSNDGRAITENTVEMTGGTVGRSIHGGYSLGNGVVRNNTVDIKGGQVTETVHGGYSNGSGNVTENKVFVSSGEVGKAVFGGLADKNSTGVVQNNEVNITGGTLSEDVRGGQSDGSGEVKENIVTISGEKTTVNGTVYGGYSKGSGAVSNNTVTMTGGKVEKEVRGGYSNGSGDVTENEVFVKGGTVSKTIFGGFAGEKSNGEVKGNTVTIEGGTISEKVRGGYSNGAGSVIGNEVTMTGGEVKGNVYGGYSNGSGNAESNTVTINGGSVLDGIRGGQSAGGTVTGNTIDLNGGTVSGRIYAGYSNNGTVTSNTINLNGANGIDITGAWLIGSGQHVATGQNGNTLNIRNFKGRAQNIGNFDRINLDLAGLTLRAGDPIIVLTEKETTRLGNSTIHLHTAQKAIAHTNSALVPRYEVIKNKTDAGLTAENVKYEKGQITVRQNGALQALYKVEWDGPGIDSVDGDSINLVKTGETEIVPGTETMNESRLALTDFLNAAGDFILDRKLQCSLREDGSIPETCFYGAVSGGDLHHDLNGNKAWAHTTGTHWFLGIRSKLNEKQDTEKDLNGALYIEAGWGNIDTHNRWAKGNGDIHYYGIGAIGERKQKEGDWKGTYLQAHARIGRAFSDYNSRLKDGSGEKLDYDKNSTYYGAELEIGREWQYHPDYMLDSYLKYRWLHLNGFNTEINGADHKLDDIDSHRTRLGTRLNYTAEKTGMPYIGIAWEHEFDGNARGSVMGYSLKDTSLKGDSGVLELGVKFVPSEKSRWNYDFTIEGYVGQREGVMGNFVVNYLF